MKRLTKIVSRRKHGFSLKPLHNKKEPHPVFFLTQRSSFWLATLSVLAFVMGNMVGQHGWYLFLASVLGKEEIVYTGTVSPIAEVPNYAEWYQYGGNHFEHSFRQVPENILMPLPLYSRSGTNKSSIFSVSYMGSYDGSPEGSGSHPGVDIRVPIGTPVVSIANGIVDEVKSEGGFGNIIIIRHPNVPDPDFPTKRTTLYSLYAHLDSIFVSAGMIVSKGEQIGTSGMSGFASGPHLHFQIDREEAPWHPYWPFTTAEQNAAGFSLAGAVNAGLNKNQGYKNTVSPLLYVQANYAPVEDSIVITQNPRDRLLSSVEQRRLARLEANGHTQVVALHSAASSQPVRKPIVPVVPSRSSAFSSTSVRELNSQELRLQEREARQLFVGRQVEQYSITPVVQNEEVVAGEGDGVLRSLPVHSVRIRHDGTYSGRGWETITVQLLDKNRNLIKNPQLNDDLSMRTSYGEAEFRPSTLTSLDFKNGEATVNMLPLGRRTVVIQAWPFAEQSAPMAYKKDQ